MADRPRLCIFGDSHYACLKQAEVQGLVDFSGVDLEYWGHVGGRFRYLEVRDGAIWPTDDFTAMRFAKFNEKGRTFLPAADFDVILVMGARVYIWRLFLRVLTLLSAGPMVSEGLLRRILTDDLRRHLGYRLARGLAESGTARILLAPTAYFTEGDTPVVPAIPPEVAALIPDRVPGFWRVLEEAAAEDGVTLLRQPEETVAQGMFSALAYAVDGHPEKQDYEHHNAAFGAAVLSRVMPIVHGMRHTGAGGGLAAAPDPRQDDREREA